MKSSDPSRRPPHLLSFLLSVLIAVGMWYMVSVRDRLEAQFDVNLDYYGIPANLVITDGLITKATVRLRGPETLLRSVTQRKLIQAVNLSNIKKGTTVVPSQPNTWDRASAPLSSSTCSPAHCHQGGQPAGA